MPSQLLRNLTQEQKDEFQYAWVHSEEMRRKMRDVLTKEYNDAIIESESPQLLDSPNYIGKIADLQGFRRGLKRAIDLVFKDQE